MKISRRKLIQTVGAATAISPFMGPVKAFGQTTEALGLEDHLYVQIQIEGAADVLQSLDPALVYKDVPQTKLQRNYSINQIRKSGNIDLGPGAHALLAHASDIALVRGVWMSTAAFVSSSNPDSHEYCRAYVASGQNMGEYQTTNMVAEVAACMGSGPAGIIMNTTEHFNNYSRSDIKSSIVTDLLNATGSGDSFSVADETESLLNGRGGWSSNLQTFLESRGSVAGFQKAAKDKMAASNVTQLSLQENLKLALSTGLAKQMLVNLGGDYSLLPGAGGLDSHGGGSYTDYNQHLGLQTWYWNWVAEFITLLKATPYKNTGKSVFDHTTIMVTNEFSRSAKVDEGYESSPGKSHNPQNNTILFAGKGVKGGTVVGGSVLVTQKNSYSGDVIKNVGAPVDFNTGKAFYERELLENNFDVVENRIIRPENISQTLREILGIDRDSWASLQKKNAKVIKSIVKA